MRTEQQIERAKRYVVGIRNRVKQRYASGWLAWQLGLEDHAPVHPENLSVMGGQAVRITLGLMLETEAQAQRSAVKETVRHE